MTIAELQNILLEMLKEFDQYCEEQQLTYFADCGTLLGAIREKGFIPWDDDLDITMPRADYEKFIATYSGPLVVKATNESNDDGIYFSFTKILPKGKGVERIDDDEFNIHQEGIIGIDLYPIDSLGTNVHTAERLCKRIQRIEYKLYLIQSTDESKNWLKRFIVRQIRKTNPKKVLLEMEKEKKKFVGKPSTIVTRWRTQEGKKVLLPAEIFKESIRVPFYDMEISAPVGYESYLRISYGDDYMVPRREEVLRHSTTTNTIAEKFATQMKNEKER